MSEAESAICPLVRSLNRPLTCRSCLLGAHPFCLSVSTGSSLMSSNLLVNQPGERLEIRQKNPCGFVMIAQLKSVPEIPIYVFYLSRDIRVGGIHVVCINLAIGDLTTTRFVELDPSVEVRPYGPLLPEEVAERPSIVQSRLQSFEVDPGMKITADQYFRYAVCPACRNDTRTVFPIPGDWVPVKGGSPVRVNP